MESNVIPISAYPEYRVSPIPWLERTPSHWAVSRLDQLFKLRSETPRESDGRVTGYLDGRVTLRSNVAGQKIKGVVHETGWQRIHVGDFAISGMNAHLGGMGVSDSEGKCSPIYLVLEPLPDTNAHFVSLAVRHAAHLGAIKALVQTIRFNSADMKRADLKKIFVPVPSKTEQEQIVRFVRQLDSRVNRLIKAKRRLIELLNEQKQAIIHQAVTRGLDPTAPLKPSGITWLGEIPAHWKILPLKRWVSTKITDGPHETPEFLEFGVDFVSAEAMVNGKIDFSRRRGFISQELHDRYCQKCRPQRDDIFMCKSGATTGKVSIVETDREFSVWSPLALIRTNPERVIPHLLFRVLQSGYVMEQVRDSWSYGTQPNLGMAKMERIFIALPEIKEQEAILKFLDSEIRPFDEAASKALAEIDLIREYRTRLVADVVTGQLDVRQHPWANSEIEDSTEAIPDDAELEDDLEETDDVLEEVGV